MLVQNMMVPVVSFFLILALGSFAYSSVVRQARNYCKHVNILNIHSLYLVFMSINSHQNCAVSNSFNTCTQVGIAGVPADTVMKKTRTIEDDWTPVWDEEFTFSLTFPELALLRVEVHEYDRSGKDDFGGQTCLPVSELRPGIRCVPLYNEKGMKFRSVRLLMRFSFI